MSNDLVRLPSPSIGEIEVMAKHVANSGMFGMNQPQAFTLMLVAQAKGLHPIQAVERYHVIQGRPTMKADAILAEWLASGGKVKWHERTHTCWSATFTHPQFAPEGEKFEFTMEDAQMADLPRRNENWKKYPGNMLRARLVSNAIRTLAPGVITGIYTPEEAEDMEPLRASARITEADVEAEVQQVSQGRASSDEEPHRPDSSALLKTFKGWRDGLVKWGNQWWEGVRANAKDPESLAPYPEICSKFQLQGHICKFCIAQGWLVMPPAQFNTTEADKALAELLYDHLGDIDDEAKRYIKKDCAADIKAKVERNKLQAAQSPADHDQAPTHGDAYEGDLQDQPSYEEQSQE